MQDQTQPETTDQPIPWGVIGLLLGAAFVVILNETTMAVALPVLMGDLHVEAQTAQWLTTGFMLTMAVVIPTTGFVMNRFTTRQVFLTALGLFSAGTLLAAVAPAFGALLLARVVQASGTAIMMPLLMTNILVLVPLHKRGQVMGLISIVMSMAPALGPSLSGVILRYSHWRTIFWVMLPIALVMLVIGAIRLINVGERSIKPIDPISILLSAFGFGGLVFALNKVGAPGQLTVMIGSFAVAAVALGLFVWRQLVLDRPLLELRTFKHRNFTVGLGVLMIGFTGLMGVFLVYPIYLQEVRGLDTQAAGLLMLPGGLAMGLLGPLIGRLHDRFGARRLVVPATAMMTAMVFALSVLTTTSTPVVLLAAMHVLLCLSLSFVFTPIFATSLGDLPPHLYADASALVGTLQQVAGAAGAALLVTVMAERAKSLTAAGTEPVQALLAGTHATFTLATVLAAGSIVLALLLRPTRPAEPTAPIGDAEAEPAAAPA
ncbi:DHA2 family efflux MFS transporter permease subunit [Naumannella sp. ID2617S]|nr:DHA2 family efflux MFS transporter permease subunit [Naumannella sp. ID2617S]